MKMIKKLLVAVLAMAMVIGTMAVSAFAADEVHVAGDEALTGVAWSTTDNAMTDNGDGTYTITFKDVKAGEYGFKVVKGDSWGDAYNLDGAANGMGDDAKVTVEKDGSSVTITFDGEKAAVTVAEGTADAPVEDAPAGDSTAVMGYVVAAVVALAAVVTVISKKRSVEA
jgi:hypothetical protein